MARLTEECNYNCPFCEYRRSACGLRKTLDARTLLPFLTALRVYLDDRRQAGLVSFLGGEPFLYPRFGSLVGATHSLGFDVGVTTNGSSLGSRAARELLGSLKELTVSIDGNRNAHSRARETSEASYDRLLTSIGAAKAARPKLLVRVNTIIMRDSVDTFPQMLGDLRAAGVDEITFNLLTGNETPGFVAENAPSAETFEEFLSLVREVAVGATLPTLRLTADYVSRLRATLAGRPCAIDFCDPGANTMFVDVNGMVSNCSFSIDYMGKSITSIKTAADVDDLVQTWSSKRLKMLFPPCRDCPETNMFGKFG